jgi:inhibitor of cysteine peptidase
MSRGVSRVRALALALLVVPIVQAAAVAESDSIVDAALLGITTDAGVYEPGGRIALEIVDPSSGLVVEKVALLAADRDILVDTYDPTVDAATWLGVVELRDEDGLPLPPGDYSLAVFTSEGAFLADISVVASLSEASRQGLTASVSFSGPALVVRQLATDADAAAGIRIWSWNTLLVALEGNPTTGFSWSDVTENALPILTPVAGTDYFPSPASAGLVGGGGLFAFRYEPSAPGTQVLRFEYARPWETTPAESVVLFSVEVID